MGNVRVISLGQSDYFRILPFLFPGYSVVGPNAVISSSFIQYRDIKSRSERESLDFDYSDCIFISRQIFDEVWSEDVIRREVLGLSLIHI